MPKEKRVMPHVIIVLQARLYPSGESVQVLNCRLSCAESHVQCRLPICRIPERVLADLPGIDIDAATVCAGMDKAKTGKINELFVYDNFNRVSAERVEAGDICAFTGLSDVCIGETVCARDAPIALPTIEVIACLC